MSQESFPEIVIGFATPVVLKVKIETCYDRISHQCTGKYVPTRRSRFRCLHCERVRLVREWDKAKKARMG